MRYINLHFTYLSTLLTYLLTKHSKCLHESAPAYLIDELCQVADVKARRRLRSSSSSSLIVSRTRLSTIGDRAFPVASAHVWNSLPDHVTSAPSVALFRSRLKTHLFNISYPSPLWLYSACAVTLSYFGHFNRSCLLAIAYTFSSTKKLLLLPGYLVFT